MFILGIDFGQASDYTALAIVQTADIPTGLWDTRGFEKTRGELQLRHLERFALKTPYPKIVEKITERVRVIENIAPGRVETIPTGDPQTRIRVVNSADYVCICDYTGVGRPIVDLLRQADLQTIGLTITGGAVANRVPGSGFAVPKRDLIAATQIALQQGKLKFADMPETDTLIRELLTMKVKISEEGHDSYGAWREGEHDDLALAVSMAVWYAKRNGFE